MTRHLITTADERSWKFDRPVLLLGEWCRLYERSPIWKGLDATVAEPYGLQESDKARNLKYVESLSTRLLAEIIEPLNSFHHTSHSLRFWHIVLGHWLRRYVEVTFNRYRTLEQALGSGAVSGTTVLDPPGYSLATTDSISFIWACNDDLWNHVLYADILRFWGNLQMEPASAPLPPNDGYRQPGNNSAESRFRLRRLARRAVHFVLSRFSRKHDAFILNSFLPLPLEIRLQLVLGQCPQLWSSPPIAAVEPDPQRLRQFRLETSGRTGYEQFVRARISDVIPTCYLEGYEVLGEQVETLPWPSEPKFIFTSNNFDADEIFKVWAASKAEQGTPYFTGQHGSNYGTHVYFGNQHWPERAAADAFFTWGWADDDPRNIPAFIFKTAGLKSQRRNVDGGVLLIELHPEHRFGPQDLHVESGIYQEEQFRFVEALPAHVRSELTVRLHPAYRHFRWADEQRWRDRCPDVHVETGQVAIEQLIARNRIVVHSYDSSGILEMLSLNTPMMCFWPRGLAHLLPSAKPYFELLREAGILADTPEQMAAIVSLRWTEIERWWATPTVQEARRRFCGQYARTDATPVRTLKRLVCHAANSKQ